MKNLATRRRSEPYVAGESESLEPRWMPAQISLVHVDDVGTVLLLVADRVGEEIQLSTSVPFDNLIYIQKNGVFTQIKVPEGNGPQGQVLLSQLNGIEVIGSLGNDNLFVNGSFFDGKTISIKGLDGNDSLGGPAEGNNKLSGGKGNDTLIGGDVHNELDGGEGDDLLIGGDGVDVSVGGEGNDVIYGARGNDSLTGGAGNDQIFGEDGEDMLWGNDGDDLLYGGRGSDAIHGGAGDDVIDGCDLRQIVDGGARDDGENPNDFLYGEEGRDLISDTGTGEDLLDGGPGRDFLYGGKGNDHVIGGDGRDDLHGETGDDLLEGGNNDDKYFFAEDFGQDQSSDWGHDTVHDTGSVLDDTGYEGGDGLVIGLLAEAEFNIYTDHVFVRGNGDNTILVDNSAMEYLAGGPGSDSFVMHDNITSGQYVLYGGEGQDTIDYNPYLIGVNVNLGQFLVTGPEIPTPYYAGRATGTRVVASIENAIGGAGDDELTGSIFANILIGNMGNDRIYGLDGNDLLDGFIGDDYLDGGPGGDRYRYIGRNLGRDIIVESGLNVSHDVLDFSGFVSDTEVGVTLTLDEKGVQPVVPGSLQLLVKGGGFEEVIGSDFNDTIYGGIGNETIRGGVGNDTISGGSGSNVLDGGGGRNTFYESADANFTLTNTHVTVGGGSSVISNFQRAVLNDGKGSHTLNAATFTGDLELFGNGGNDTLIAGLGSNSLDGGPGNDVYVFGPVTEPHLNEITEISGGGIDRLDFSKLPANDPVLVDLAGAGGIVARHTNREIRLFNSGAFIENATGGRGDDRLIGNDAVNLLQGLSGNDTLNGGRGSDQLDGGVGRDIYVFSENWGADKLVDSDAASAGGELDFSPVTSALTFAISTSTVKISGGKNKLATQNVFVNLTGGSGDDLFKFANGAHVAGGSGQINGQGGINSLDYSVFKTPVAVNLETGVATGASHVTNIRYVTGGASADTLIGNALANTLKGNAGDDQLIGGAGKDLLDGGAGVDSGDGGLDVDVGLGLESITDIP